MDFTTIIIICCAIFLICIAYILIFDTNYKKINYSKICAIILIILLLLILYYNGFFYKFTIINKNNINEIITSNKLSENDKMKIALKYFLGEDIYGKMIFEIIK